MNRVTKISEVIFIVSSIIFNLAISGVYISSKIDLTNIFLKISGGIVVSLIIPFTITLFGFIISNAKIKIIISNIIIIFYLLLEILLDYILKIPFRQILSIHIPYIIIFYAASFSIIGVCFTINRKIGFIVLGTFIILIGCLVYNLS